MTGVDQVVKIFLETWQKRKSGVLPMPDLTVNCSRCGVELKGDSKTKFAKDGLLCLSYFKGN